MRSWHFWGWRLLKVFGGASLWSSSVWSSGYCFHSKTGRWVMKIIGGEGVPQPSSHWTVQREATSQVKAGDTTGISDSLEKARPCHLRSDKSRQLVFPNHTKAHKCPSLWDKRQAEHGDGQEHRQRRNVHFPLERKIFPSDQLAVYKPT